MSSTAVNVRRAFGLLFIMVAVAVFLGAVINEEIFLNGLPFYFYPIGWIGSFAVVFGVNVRRLKRSMTMIRHRMKNSTSWGIKIKSINGLCWAAPFLLIGVFPDMAQYLILVGIGLGNMSTYIFMKKFSGQDNKEQFIVAGLALSSLPIAAIIDYSLSAAQDLAVMISRILIAVSYGAGGIYAVKTSQTSNQS